MPFALNDDDDAAAWEAVELVQQDRAAGISRLRALASEGRRTATVLLALYLGEDSWGEEAEYWLRQAAAFESSDAAWNLAIFAHHRGDVEGATTWINRAADWGNEDARRMRTMGHDIDTFLTLLNESEI